MSCNGIRCRMLLSPLSVNIFWTSVLRKLICQLSHPCLSFCHNTDTKTRDQKISKTLFITLKWIGRIAIEYLSARTRWSTSSDLLRDGPFFVGVMVLVTSDGSKSTWLLYINRFIIETFDHVFQRILNSRCVEVSGRAAFIANGVAAHVTFVCNNRVKWEMVDFQWIVHPQLCPGSLCGKLNKLQLNRRSLI